MATFLEVATIESSLRLDAQQPCGKLAWLEDSYREPEEFWQLLKGGFDARIAAPGASSLFGRYNFYHDIIVCNLNNPAPAFSWYESGSGIMNVSYRELGDMVAAKAGRWAHAGLKSGQTLCIIRSLCLDMIVEMLAAMKIGCILSFLPPQGKGFLQRRLEALQPDYIVIDSMHLPLLSAWAEKVLSEKREGWEDLSPVRGQSFAYPSGQIVFQSFNPCGYEPLVPAEVTSDAAYLSALRDGMISLGLGPGHVYAAPGFHFMETYPYLLIAGLLCGATYLHLTPKAIADNPELVVQKPLKVFGVNRKVRDVLRDTSLEIGSAWECWFRNPSESIDLEQWHFFIKNLKLEKAYAFNLRWNAALGGCSLFSVRRKGMAHMNVMPVPGSAWCLGELSGGEFESAMDIGTYTVSEPGTSKKEKKTTCDILVKNRHEWFFAGLNTSHREGRIFPFQEILDSLRTMENRYGCFCSFVDVPLVDAGSEHRFTLLVFLGAKTNVDETRLASEIRSVITRDMGDEYQPDKMQFFPLFPRFLSGREVDHQWCRNQYLNGALFRRERGRFFHYITRLRECLMTLGDLKG